jgi:hypothetical protein
MNKWFVVKTIPYPGATFKMLKKSTLAIKQQFSM